MSESTSGNGLIKKILVGTDGSDTAAIAVNRAASIAAALGAELVVVSAYSGQAPGKLGSGIGSDAAWHATAGAAAKEHVTACIRAAAGWRLGSGHGPVSHLRSDARTPPARR